MGFTDKTLQCSDCGGEFIFTADEQEFHANKGYTNEPKRCPTCREARRTSVVTSADIDLADKCIPPYVLTVAKNVKFLLSLEKAGQYIVVSVTAR